MALTGWQVRTYFDNVHHKAQESRAKVLGTTLQKTGNARMIGFPVLDVATGQTRTSRFAPTPNNTPGRTMRFAFPRAYTINLMEDNLDELEHFWNADSEYVRAEAAAMNREQTKRLHDAALGSALEVDQDTHGTAGTSVSLPATQVVAHGSATLTAEKVIEARTKLDVAVGGDVETFGPYYFLYDPDDFRQLANESQFISLDNVSQQMLMSGQVVNGLLGFNWIPTGTLTVASNIRSCVAYARSGMGLGQNGSPKMRAGERADINYTMQVYREDKYDYVRIDDKAVVEVLVDTTAALS